MPIDVFISYAHSTAQAVVRQLRDELSKDGLKVFLDERDIPHGSPFPRDIADALIDSRLSIVFADETYFRRPWCVYEFQVITGPYRAAGEPEDGQVEHVVVALPSSGDVASLVAHLPPPLARESWPSAEGTAEIAAMIRSRLEGLTSTLGSRLANVNDDALTRLRAGGDIPLAWTRPATAVPGDAGTMESGRPMYVDLVPETRGEMFIGRSAEIWRVFHHLVTCRAFTTPRTCAVQGAGGSGKSQLAAEFVARYGNRFFPGGIIWISAESNVQTLVSQFRSVWRLVAANEPDPAAGETEPARQRERLAAALSQRFASGSFKDDMIWVVDGVPEPAGTAGDRPRKIGYWCPALGHVNVLVTSRRTGLEQMDDYVDLSALPVATAVDWLTRPNVERKWLKEDEWADIAEWVGGLPLAIAILRTSLSDGFTTAEALKLARRKEPSLLLDREMNALRGEVADERLRGVTEAFDFSYCALGQNPELQHATHLIAHLAPYPLAERVLAELIPTAATGRLARRSWIQASTAPGTDRAVRRWTMHRIPASFLRARTTDIERVFTDLFQWLRRINTKDLPEDDTRGLEYHLMVIQRRLREQLDQLGDDSSAVQAAREFAVAAAGAQPKFEDRGLRWQAADLANTLGAGDEVAALLEQWYETGDANIAESIPHTLAVLEGIPRAVGLMSRLIKDERQNVRLQAIVHAPGLFAIELALPLLEAILREPTGGWTAFYDNYLDNRCLALRTILSHLARCLNEGTPQIRERAAELLGRVLIVNGKNLAAGGFTSGHVIGALMRVALNDDSESVASAAVSAVSLYFDDEAYRTLTKELSQAQDTRRRARVLGTLGDYLSGTRRPSPPKIMETEFIDSGGFKMKLDRGGAREPLPADAYHPLIEAAQGPDALCAAIAAKAILDTGEGKIAVGKAASALLNSQAYTRAAALAEALVSQEPDFTNAVWWRGQARMALGDTAGALADFAAVIEQAPQFSDAYLRRGQLLCESNDFGSALPSLQRAAELDPQLFDAHLYAAVCLYNLKRYNDAEAAADRAIALAPGISQAWFFRGIARYSAGRPAEALEDIKRAVELDPADERASQFKTQLEAYLDEKKVPGQK